MAITGGFGTMIDLERGTMRNWVMGSDGVKRWADNGEPVSRFKRTPEHDRRVQRGDDFAGDAWLDTESGEIVYGVVGHDRNRKAECDRRGNSDG